MAKAIKEYVTDNIYETLGDIAQLTGFENDATVQREKPRGVPRKDREITIVDLGDTPITDSPLNKDDYTANYALHCRCLVSDEIDGTAPTVDQQLSRLIGDVRKALMQDYTRGANAINTMIGQDGPLPTGDDGRTLPVQVHYRTAKDDPFSL